MISYCSLSIKKTVGVIMASIEIILRDNQGNIINEEKKRIYDLNIGNKKFSELRFNDIERAVGEFKRISLPDVTSDLLKEAQEDYKNEIKKKRSYSVTEQHQSL